jgi:glyoxylase-like metal-dependent hydrolase (beta-lactamase superfamily II)
LPTSSFEDIISSITNKLITLPEDTIVYPGHRKINNNKRRKADLFGNETKRMGIKGGLYGKNSCKNFTRFYGIITTRTNII